MRDIFLWLLCLLPFISDGQGLTHDKMIPWSANKLAFDDFIIVPDSDDKGDTAAFTDSRITYNYQIVNGANGQKNVLRVEVRNVFIQSPSSWMKKSYIGNRALLNHEQGHFDIGEIFARKFRNQIKNYPFTKNYVRELSQLFSQISDKLNQKQLLYDEETAHGLNAEQQLKWNEKIQHALQQHIPAKNILFCNILI